MKAHTLAVSLFPRELSLMSSLASLLRTKEHQNLSGKLRPSGRFSVVQLFPKKSKVLNHASKKTLCEGGLRTVQEIDEAFNRLSHGGLPVLHEMRLDKEKGVSGLGLSDAAISRNRSKRGSRGINAAQRDRLCWGAGQIEFMYGKRNLSFVTYTLPALDTRDLVRVQDNWSKIVNRVVERIRRKLEQKGYRSTIAGCTELQLERYEKTGQLYPHLHLVFKGREHSNAGWSVKPEEYRRIWSECVSPFLLDSEPSWEASECVIGVVKSVAGYLSKYISKCASKHVEGGRGNWHPSDWIVLSRTLRRLYEKYTYSGYGVGLGLFDLVSNWRAGLGYMSRVTIKTPAYGERTIGFAGWLKDEIRYVPWKEFCITDNVVRSAKKAKTVVSLGW